MRKRLAGIAVGAVLAAISPHASAAPAPQLTDPAGDANFTANIPHAAARNQSAAVGNQAYADVTSVVWEAVKTKKKVGKKFVMVVTGFKVTATLGAAPTPPNGTNVVYRILSHAPCGADNSFFGVVYYTDPGSDPAIPQSALRENCTGVTRLTPIALPTIAGSTLTWNVPLSVVPADTKVKVGTSLTGFWFETRELQDFQGQCLPDDGGLSGFGKACGLAVGIVDNAAPNDTVWKIA